MRSDGVPQFLSCLFGSERAVRLGNAGVSFLSCLFGSEREPQAPERIYGFSKLPIRQ